MKKAFYASFNKALNAYLSLDPNSKKKLRKLENKVITIDLLPSHTILQFILSDESVTLKEEEILDSDVKIIATPIQLTSLIIAQENRQQFFIEDVKIEGDAELGQAIIELFDELEIDWEEQLSHFVGDISAHHVGRVFHGIKSWAARFNQSMAHDINEYLHEELKLFPTANELNNYYDEIDHLALALDRAEARLSIIADTLKKEDQ